MSLFYPYLGETETLSLFQMNISRLQRIEQERTEIMAIDSAKVMTIEEEDIVQFAKEHFKRHKENADTYAIPCTFQNDRSQPKPPFSHQAHVSTKFLILMNTVNTNTCLIGDGTAAKLEMPFRPQLHWPVTNTTSSLIEVSSSGRTTSRWSRRQQWSLRRIDRRCTENWKQRLWQREGNE